MKSVKKRKTLADFPELAAELHPTDNGDLKPEDVGFGSNKKLIWQCKKVKEHIWPAEVGSRSKGRGCPYCAGRKVSIDNCLATTHPELAAELHPTENKYLTAENITAGSGENLIWQCKKVKEHIWPAKVSNRVNGTGCPYCAGRKVCIDNCLATTHPELAAELHPTENGDLTAEKVTAGSHKIAVWQCQKVKEHIWPAPVNERSKGRGCPYCAGRKVSIDNCLATTHPELAAELHPTENKDLTAENITAGSNKKLIWQCKKVKEHKWPAEVRDRSKKGSGCPYCAESKGENKISELLKIMGLPFKRQAKFKKCKNKNVLPFDFIVKLPNGKGFLIEYQGIQHYEPIRRSRSWTKKKTMAHFKAIQERDKIKSEWAKKNKIPLLVIPCWDHEKMPKLIEEFVELIKRDEPKYTSS